MENEVKKAGDEIVVQRLADIVEQLTKILQQVVAEKDELVGEKREHDENIKYLREDLCLVRASVARVITVLHEGNGQKPLITRVALLEERQEERKEAERQAAGKELVKTKGKWAVRTAIVAGVLSLAATILTKFF